MRVIAGEYKTLITSRGMARGFLVVSVVNGQYLIEPSSDAAFVVITGDEPCPESQLFCETENTSKDG